MQEVISSPRSRAEIRELAKFIRTIAGYNDNEPIPVLDLAENKMQEWFENYGFIVETQEEMGRAEGLSSGEGGYIKIREDVYEKALKGDGRSRFTIAHEIFHFIFHVKGTFEFARMGEKIPIYMNPEWHADCFAGELLMPYEKIKNMSEFSIVERYEVSSKAAEYQLSKIKRPSYN